MRKDGTQHGWPLCDPCWVKEAKLKRVYSEQFHFYEVWEQTKIYGNKHQNGLVGGGREPAEAQIVLYLDLDSGHTDAYWNGPKGLPHGRCSDCHWSWRPWMMSLRKDNPHLDVITPHPLCDGVRAMFLFAYNFTKLTAARLPVLITASQSVKVFWKGLMECSQECSIINCRARGAWLPLQLTGQSLEGADGHRLEKGVGSAMWLCPAQGLHPSEENPSEGRWAAPARGYVTGSTSQIPTFKVSPS